MPKKSIYKSKTWAKHYSKNVALTYDYEKKTLIDYLEEMTNRHPDSTALIFQGYKLSFKEFRDMVDRLATAFADWGIKKDDKVAILLPNTIQCVVAYYAGLKAGAVIVMNNPLYSDRELEHQLNDSKSQILVCIDLLANRMIDLRPKTKVKQIVTCSIGDYLPFPKDILFPLVAKRKGLKADVKEAQSVFPFKEIIKKYSPNPPRIDLSFDDIAMLQYTGGTTGVSKGVMLSHANISINAQQCRKWFSEFIEGEERGIAALPYFHVFGLTTVMNLSIMNGWTQILIPRPEPQTLLESISKYKPTFAPLVPTMFIGMLNHSDLSKYDLSSLKGCFSGSAPLPLEIKKKFEEITNMQIVEGFGLTESSPVTHCNPFGEGTLEKEESIGIPFPDTESKIVDIDNGKEEMPVNEQGELIIKGPQVMKGYWNKPEETKNTLRKGWLYTGDIAKMDEDGYFYIVDRKKDMIIASGYNIYPRDIDEVLFRHPKVQEACTIGIPDKYRGETVKVFIVLKEGKTASEEEILKYCKENLARYKVPKFVEFRDELPKSTIGKILRKELRKEELEKSKPKKGKK
ncbi:MAG: long-chain fatty acid--CoA ligase [Spirochaetota bacterium]|nr:long-chain fatty acid--CoA ligase [Spirochaetota bacterium]